ncbi:hypothetical protein P5673_022147 [Acropora cervicornis]|uniref:Uncharacterized protein n=1 Tax=Acropora cervicornis TaxID=6130 RepID=A0AAD9Q870_ACRCE|nr:hypothetical protein P5673_022147 [Acropora cervicornis]
MEKKPLHVNGIITTAKMFLTDIHVLEALINSNRNPVNCNMLLCLSTLHRLPAAIQLNGY